MHKYAEAACRPPAYSTLRAWWREVSEVRPRDGGSWPAVRVGVAVTVPLAVLLAVGHADWTLYAVFGSISAVYSKHSDYAVRWRHQAGMGFALTFAVVLGVLVSLIEPGSMWAVTTISVLSLMGYVLAQRFGWLPVPSLFMVFAAGAVSAYEHTRTDVPLAAALSLSAVLFGIIVGQLGRLSRHPRGARNLESMPRLAFARADATAYLLGPWIAGGIAVLVGIGHPYWAAVSATVPLVGATFMARFGRASLRFAGTVVGIGVAFVVLTLDPPIWFLVLMVALFQTATELFVARNYGMAVVSLTPLALILSHLADPGPIPPLLFDRLLETLLGIVVAVLVLLALRWSQRRIRLEKQRSNHGGSNGSVRSCSLSR